jgi:light-regulated signal transduction histidine kinase (bacteriophytochrome)
MAAAESLFTDVPFAVRGAREIAEACELDLASPRVARLDGIGIDPGHLASIFDMFTQVDRANRRTQGGLGIGLTLVRSLVSMHGGTVLARSSGVGRHSA